MTQSLTDSLVTSVTIRDGEFIKENKRVNKKENTLSTKKATKKKRKNDNSQEKERKHALD